MSDTVPYTLEEELDNALARACDAAKSEVEENYRGWLRGDDSAYLKWAEAMEKEDELVKAVVRKIERKR